VSVTDRTIESVARVDHDYRPSLMSYFLRRVRNRTEAEDLTQEVFLRMLRREAAEPLRRTDSFLFKIAANLLRDRARRERARPEVSNCHVAPEGTKESEGTRTFLEDGVDDLSPERVLIGRESLVDAVKALDELGGRTRDIFVLFRMDGMKQREIAAAFGVSVSAVEKHVVKALAHLAQRFPAE
jgi:RNA polymerase sigma-70 factor (ECF subfamily)